MIFSCASMMAVTGKAIVMVLVMMVTIGMSAWMEEIVAFPASERITVRPLHDDLCHGTFVEITMVVVMTIFAVLVENAVPSWPHEERFTLKDLRHFCFTVLKVTVVSMIWTGPEENAVLAASRCTNERSFHDDRRRALVENPGPGSLGVSGRVALFWCSVLDVQ